MKKPHRQIITFTTDINGNASWPSNPVMLIPGPPSGSVDTGILHFPAFASTVSVMSSVGAYPLPLQKGATIMRDVQLYAGEDLQINVIGATPGTTYQGIWVSIRTPEATTVPRVPDISPPPTVGSNVISSLILGPGVVNISNCDGSIAGSALIGAANGIAATDSTGHLATPINVLSGNISAPVTCGTSATTKLFDTASLAVGTWLLEFGVCLSGGAAICELIVAADTATVPTLTGQASSQLTVNSASAGAESPSLTCLAVVTIAGTVQLQLKNNNASNTVTCQAVTPQSSEPFCSGYVAVKVA